MSITDEQIQAAYRGLDDTLAPPMDSAERIGRRIVVRRRRRRAALAGTGGLAALAVVGSLLVLNGGDNPGDAIATDPTGQGSTLVMTRPDGSTYAFDDVTVSCRPPNMLGDADGTPGRPGRIYLFSPIEITGNVDGGPNNAHADQPFVSFEGVIAKIQGDPTFTLPIDAPRGSDDFPISLFMDDPNQSPQRDNEVSSSEAGSVGTVRVLEASCDPVPMLRLQVDATLGSEVNQETLAVTGGLR